MKEHEIIKELEIMRLKLKELCSAKKIGDGSKQIIEIHELSKKRTLLLESKK